MHPFDLELTSQDIQVLHDGDSVAVFLTNLGYDTRARIPQTAANLGIPEPTQRRIKHIELLADHDKFLQVYLFELKNVTVADIKAIGRAFRDKAGNFLFVITADYEYIDFVLLDRIGPAKSPTAISAATPSLVQRRFSVDLRCARQPISRYYRIQIMPSIWPMLLSSSLPFFTRMEWSIGAWPRSRSI
jgi:hypothetical protein